MFEVPFFYGFLTLLFQYVMYLDVSCPPRTSVTRANYLLQELYYFTGQTNTETMLVQTTPITMGLAGKNTESGHLTTSTV